MDIAKAKIEQACKLLDELDIDLWLLFVRESSMQADPALPLVIGFDVTWQSFFAFSRTGKSYALVGNFDDENVRRSGRFSEVHSFTQSVRDDFCNLIDRIVPRTIAVNYSTSDPAADGLTHGMYQLLCEYLANTPYADRLISAEDLLSKLRSRKLDIEISRLSSSAITAVEAWRAATARILPGMTEIEIAAVIDDEIQRRNVIPSFSTIVNAGDKSKPGHALPSTAKLEPGDLLHVDFGVKLDDYCSDLQRLIYFRRPGESTAPQELIDAFEHVADIITETAALCRPGAQGHEIDSEARKMLVEHGYPEYQHALGHQLGRAVHDGGAIIGPKWERYGRAPTMPMDSNNAFTLELEIILPGIGCVGLEEDICVTETGGRFLCPRQQELIIR
ncbi:MAG: M24 family metallopeptidase [Candidatus Zixiibacteriota bacterium]